MSRKRPLVLMGAAGVVALLVSPPLAAQEGPLLLEVYGARTDSLARDRSFGGLALTSYNGAFGLRLGGGLHFIKRPSGAVREVLDCNRWSCTRRYDSPSEPYLSSWTADMDALFEPARPVPLLRALLLGFSPYGFVGIGGVGERPGPAVNASVVTRSYGVGVHHEVLGWLGVAAEARYRRPVRDDILLPTGERWSHEYRVGLTATFGGERERPARPRRRRPVEPPPARGPCGYEPCPSGRVEGRSTDSRLAARVLDVADGYVGTPYRYGGTRPSTGFDGAGFVRHVFARVGVSLPRTAREIARSGEEVPTDAGSLRAGDLLLFANDGRDIVHVAIYVDHDRIIHSSASGGGVRYDVLGEGERGRWFSDHLVGARRVVDRGRSSWRSDWSRDFRQPDPPDGAPPPDRTPR